MLTLSKAALSGLADLVYDRIGERGFLKGPGGEYDSIRLFLKDIGLAPPAATISREHWGTRDTNISATKSWLLSYLTELNSRQARGEHLPAAIEQIIIALLSNPVMRDEVAPVLDRLLDPFGIGVSWSEQQSRYILKSLLGQPATSIDQPLPHLIHDAMELHPVVRERSASLFKSGHYAQAVFEACKALEELVSGRLASIDHGTAALHGRNLMGRALDLKKPGLRINDLKTISDRDEHEGYHLLLMGVVLAIRNPLAHMTVEVDPYRALESLAVLSLLAWRVEGAATVTSA